MSSTQKAKVFKTGRSQAVRIPFEFRFQSDEVYIRRDPRTGDVILSQSPKPVPTWEEIFAALDAAHAAGEIPGDFLMDREQTPPVDRF